MTWMPSDPQIVQMSHFAIAWAIVATLRFYGCRPLTAMVWPLAWAVLKEFIFDLLVEGDTWENSVNDFAWYCAGVAASNMVLRWLQPGSIRRLRKLLLLEDE